jgi:hypothetical protein
MKILITTLLMSATALTAQALTADEIINSGKSPEEIGHALAVEADKRDFGFGDSESSMQMILENAHGEKSVREMRNKTFEMADVSLGDKSIIVFDKPKDVKGTAFLTHSKILEADDQWLYLPALKRVKRISSKNKSGPFMGSEFSYEDIASQEVDKYTYKFIAEEKCDNGMDCVKVERYPSYKHSGYTKQVVWFDKDEFRVFKTDSYDRKSELMKTLTSTGFKQYLGQYWRADKFHMVNHQTNKKTTLTWEDYKFRTGQGEGDFTKAKLKRVK